MGTSRFSKNAIGKNFAFPRANPNFTNSAEEEF